ncbi:MAG TPA: MFS transporter [Candidatus Nitrosocosmicus sp.]|nr:MFS transporter [Candidatus Nitrosocosmicus sp.]
MPSTINKQISLFPLLLSNFIGTISYSIVLPFLVFLVIGFGGNSLIYGIVSAIYPAFQLIGSPVLGRWSDIYGRKKILLLSNGGTLAGWIIFLSALFLPVWHVISINSSILGSFIVTLPLMVLFAARALDGITGGNISVANAYLADVSKDKDRSKNFGKLSISANLGFIVGPALAGVLGGTIYKELLPVISAVLISSMAFVVVGFMLKESKPKESVAITFPERKNINKVLSFQCKECYKVSNPKKLGYKDILKIKDISFLIILYFFIFLGFNIFYTAFPNHAVVGLKWSVTQMGIFYAVLSGMMIFIQGPILRKAIQILSEQKLVIIGSLILGINFILFVSNNTALAYVAAILFALGNGLMWPSFMSILSRRAGTDNQGVVQGVASSFGSIASIIGLIMGGLLYNTIGSTTFLISAAVIFLVFIMSFRLLKIEKAE